MTRRTTKLRPRRKLPHRRMSEDEFYNRFGDALVAFTRPQRPLDAFIVSPMRSLLSGSGSSAMFT